MDAISTIAHHAVASRFRDLSSAAVAAAKTFILDTLGVGLAGSANELASDLARTCATWGQGQDARVWGRDMRLPAPTAAMCNAYQVHNSEFDCLHEGAVVHAMSVVLPAAIAGAERNGNVSGPQLIAAVAVGVDVSASLGDCKCRRRVASNEFPLHTCRCAQMSRSKLPAYITTPELTTRTKLPTFALQRFRQLTEGKAD